MSGKLYTSSYVREEDGRRIQMSGNTYVPMRCWEDRNSGKKFEPVIIKLPKNCDHGITVCPECVVSWSWDHDIKFDRTQGGRALLGQIEAIPKLNESVHFTNREFVPGQDWPEHRKEC
jgi:hypothetical protein